MPGSDDLLKQKLWKTFNLKHFVNTKQKEAVKAILKRNQDVVISMGPGNRKSLCFQLPSIMLENKITIVCSASTSWIKDQIYYLKKSKISATSITSQLSDNERERLNKDVANDKPMTRFIYIKPELVSSEFFTSILQTLSNNDKLAYFAVDDAHLASPQLQDFCQDYLKFGSLRPAYPSVPCITLTHNASADVRNDIVRNLQLREPVATFTKSTFRKNIHYDIIFKNTILTNLFAHLKNFLTFRLDESDDDAKKPGGIIYCKNRDTVDMVAAKLTEVGFPTKTHHGGMPSGERKKVLDDWLTGALPVIVATTSFGAGIEKSGVRVVVHFDVPQSIAGFYRESGIAGRDGKLSYSRIYYCKSDVAEVDSTLKSAIGKSKNENAKRKALRAHADFLKMSDLCETVDCRHKIFSNYFDDIEPNCKDKCDVCTNPEEAKVALGLFHKFSAPPTRDNNGFDMVAFSPVIIKSEPHHPANGQSSDHPELGTLPARSVSPANTVIKEENAAMGNRANYSKLGDAMKAKPPGNVSPARTVIKEEPVNRKEPNHDNLNNSSALGGDRTVPLRCVSPAETLIDEKPYRSDDHSAVLSDELFAMKTLPTGNVSPARTMVKEEPHRSCDHRLSDELFAMQTLPPGNVSPARTMVKEEPHWSTDHRLSDELFAMQTLPPGNVSPARTMVKEEPHRSTDHRLSDELFAMQTLPPGNVSPARTMIKEEPHRSTDHRLSDELFAMQTLPPGNVSPARTMVKEEKEDELSGTDPRDENGAGGSIVLGEDSKAGIRLLSPGRCATPKATIADPVVDTTTVVRTTVPGGADAEYISAVIIKSEPKSPVRPIDESDREPVSNPITTAGTSNATSGISSVLTVIKREAPETKSTDARNGTTSDRESRSPSPTGTIVKDECLSPARNRDFDGLENISDSDQDDEGSSKLLNVNDKRSRARDRNTGTAKSRTKLESTTNPPAQNVELIVSSSEPEDVSSEIVDFREKSRSTIVDRSSASRLRKRTEDGSRRRSRSRARSRSRSNERLKRENKRRRRSRSSDRLKREKNVRRRSRSSSLSSRRSHSPSLSRRRSRSRSNERFNRKKGRSRRSRSRSRSRSNQRLKRERDVRRRSRSRSVSSRRSRSQERLKRETENRRRGRSNEREKSVDRKPSSSSSNSKRVQTTSKSKYDSRWSHRQFSMSPEGTQRRSEREDDQNDDAPDYGWEDPGPPKPKLEKQPNSALNGLQQHLQDFATKLQNEYDLDVIHAAQMKLNRAIDEEKSKQTKRKLDDLTDTIKKKQSDYFEKLFGTTNFDDWVDDPALSNVDNAKKLQPFKASVPDDLPLHVKMSMKHEVTAMKLRPTRAGNGLVFSGRIREIENEFQGQEVPRYLLESIKQEKEVIFELVKKYLLPYYRDARIQTKELFMVVAQKICHHFYENAADENTIRRYVDDMFAKRGSITTSTDLA
ncbi:uncharacterized protein LOC119075475 isoform X2 [Bradysia coprophila]|uniref:uncharacterized protein LOC119075475 isoform X2 n=1 Tax=Bradysia coprophila TaxID=38358 RepID=UPI00187DC0C3|nr:uncharacterized protein LOC119075475 isoform X2 [Bradysia coprophila]